METRQAKIVDQAEITGILITKVDKRLRELYAKVENNANLYILLKHKFICC